MEQTQPIAKNGKVILNQFRSWLSDFRAETNAMIDLYQKRIDELELRLSKEQISEPKIKVEDGEVFELELKGGPEKHL
jgi:hypothetical protein